MIRVGIFTLFTILVACQSAFGCWCRRDREEPIGSARSIVRELDSSDFVFSGTVTAVGGERITFDVDEAWKGQSGRRITFVYHDSVFDSCEVYFKKGDRYVVFGHVSINDFAASACGNTKLQDKAGETIKELNRLRDENPPFLLNSSYLTRFYIP